MKTGSVSKTAGRQDLLRYAANLSGASAAVYVASGALLRLLAEQFIRIFHAQATLENPIGVPEVVIAILSVLVGALSLYAAVRFLRTFGRSYFPMKLSFADPHDRRVWLLIPVFLGVGLLCSVLSGLLSAGLEKITRYTPPEPTILPQSGLALALCFASTCVVPAVFEEIFVRGCIQSAFSRWGAWFAIVMSSLIFALLHTDIAQMPSIFLLSLFLGLCAYATGSLFPGIVLHLANNTISFLLLCLQQRMDGRTAIGATIYLLLAMVFGAALCVWQIVAGGLLKKLRPLPRPKIRKKRISRVLHAPIFVLMILYLAVRALWPLFVKG